MSRTCYAIEYENTEFNYELFQDSLVSNTPSDIQAVNCAILYVENGKDVENRNELKVSASSFYSPSPYIEVDRCIEHMISPGIIRDWHYNRDSELFVYSVSGNRYCRNVKRQHSNNNIYFVFNLSTNILRQKCFACTTYSSDPIDINCNFDWLTNMADWDS